MATFAPILKGGQAHISQAVESHLRRMVVSHGVVPLTHSKGKAEAHSNGAVQGKAPSRVSSGADSSGAADNNGATRPRAADSSGVTQRSMAASNGRVRRLCCEVHSRLHIGVAVMVITAELCWPQAASNETYGIKRISLPPSKRDSLQIAILFDVSAKMDWELSVSTIF